MSIVTLSQLEEGDAVAVAAVNADINAFITATTSGASAGINEVNLVEEGLDERSINPRAITPTLGTAENVAFGDAGPYTTSDTLGVSAPVQPDGAADLVVGPLTYDSSAGDRVNVSLSFDFDGETPDGTNRSAWVVQLGRSTDYNPAVAGSGTWTWISDTVRKLSWYKETATDSRIRGPFTVAHHFTASVGGATANLYFGARIYQETAASTSNDITMRYIAMTAKLRKK